MNIFRNKIFFNIFQLTSIDMTKNLSLIHLFFIFSDILSNSIYLYPLSQPIASIIYQVSLNLTVSTTVIILIEKKNTIILQTYVHYRYINDILFTHFMTEPNRNSCFDDTDKLLKDEEFRQDIEAWSEE
jgi:hypothetical protein